VRMRAFLGCPARRRVSGSFGAVPLSRQAAPHVAVAGNLAETASPARVAPRRSSAVLRVRRFLTLCSCPSKPGVVDYRATGQPPRTG